MAQFIYANGRSGVYVTDYRDLVRVMRQVEPAMLLELKRDFRRVAQPLVKDVKKGIPKSPPTRGVHIKRPQATPSGFNPRVVPGRLTWGANKQNRNKAVTSVLAKTPRVKARFNNNANVTSIARVQVENAAVVMADMAGKSGKWINKKPQTREYLYSRSRSGSRIHRVNGQGRAMINALNAAKGQGSRFVYPAAEKAIPGVRYEAERVLQGGFDKLNQKLRS